MFAYFPILCHITVLIANFLLCIHRTVAFDPKAFDDSILYKLNWPGDVHSGVFNENGVLISSDIKEKFRCILPEPDEKSNDDVEKYTGPNPLDLLQPLLKVKRCSYKLGSYWTYEICHGTHVRQYHEDREMKTPKGQEYSLGQWDPSAVEKLREELEETDENGEKKYLTKKLPVIKIENLKLPYLRINMTGGTYCELSKKPRVTYVLYVCYKHGKHEVYSFKEISTCEYETVVLSPLLCSHPKFRPHITSEKNINCYSSPGAAPKPRGLYELEQESAKLRQNRMLDGKRKVHVEIIPVDATEGEEGDKVRQVSQLNQKALTPVEDFLSGRECLYGGSSWWKYEFCFGRSVRQFHEEKDGSKTVVQLGTFDEDLHREWLLRHPQKRPLPPAHRKQISHYYSNGDICDKTGEPRHTEVRLKCTDSKMSASAVVLSMLEPKMCEYVLNVESPVICDLLPRADKDGLFEKADEDLDLTVEVEDSLYSSSERISLPDAASGPPVDGFRLSELLENERRILEKAMKKDVRSDRVRSSATVITIEDESEEEQPKTASRERKDDRATGSQPRTFKPSDQLFENERILEKATKNDVRSERVRSSATVITIEDESEEEQPKTTSPERKDDRATGSQPRTFKPSDQREGRTLNDEL